MSEVLKHVCSFCNKKKEEVKRLIVSDAVAICNECVDLCDDLLKNEISPTTVEKTTNDIQDPMLLKSYLDQYVIGQDATKIMLSVAIVNHYKRISNTDKDIEISKANILMVGGISEYKTPEIDISFIGKEDISEQITRVIRQFRKTFGTVRFIKVDRDVKIDREDE